MTSAAVSDHAVLRYIERKHGVDVDGLRAIISEIVQSAVRAGASKVSHDGMTFVLRNGVVCTVIPGESASASVRKSEIHKGRSPRTRGRVGKRPVT